MVLSAKTYLMNVLMEVPVLRVSSGWISLGTSQPKGPHDQAKPVIKTHMVTRMPIAIPPAVSRVWRPQ